MRKQNFNENSTATVLASMDPFVEFTIPSHCPSLPSGTSRSSVNIKAKPSPLEAVWFCILSTKVVLKDAFFPPLLLHSLNGHLYKALPALLFIENPLESGVTWMAS